MSLRHFPRSVRILATALAALAASFALAAGPLVPSQTPSTYTLVSGDGRRVLPYRVVGNTDLVQLDQLAEIFGLTVKEDTAVGGLLVTAGGQRIVLTPGQPLASVNGRMLSMSGSVVRDGRSWLVPVDFLSRALGPALNTRIEVRRASHFVVLGDARVPQVSVQIDRQAGNTRVLIGAQPPTPHRITREGARLVVRFEADALDVGPTSGASAEFVTGTHVEGVSLVVDLGPQAATFRTSDDSEPGHFTIDLLAPGATAAPARPAPVQEPLDLVPSGGVRTVVIDPGHGGEDAGVHGPAGTVEKDLTMRIARRLKAAIESRIGLRVLLTREADENVPADRRTAFANNNKADLLLSLHANASIRPELRGAQVLSLSLDDYKGRARGVGSSGSPVPVFGGNPRLIEAVPWDLAQIPFANASAALGSSIVRRMAAESVPLYGRPADFAPLRILSGANMPAVLIEMGFLSNAEDERALVADDLPTAIVNALIGAIVETRGAGRGGADRQ